MEAPGLADVVAEQRIFKWEAAFSGGVKAWMRLQLCGYGYTSGRGGGDWLWIEEVSDQYRGHH